MKKKPTPVDHDQDSSPPTDTPPSHESPPFPIVGIGASAGGLEALEQLFRQVPAETGMAFVVVQHLDPTQKGLMPELLQRATTMKVSQVRDRMKVKPSCVYVIPPNRDMSILHGVLHLFEPTAPRGLRLPIDYFLRSLADDRRERSVGVILSGMGSDGTMGLRAIIERSGLALVQDPTTARFDSMPRSAIVAGLADIVAPPGDLPGKIIDFFRRAGHKADRTPDEREQGSLEKILILLRARTGQDFTLYKKNTVHRRIERRMGIHQIDRVTTYVRYLQENPQEVELLFQELLIGVTSFFRDPAAWQHLLDEAIPALLESRPAGGVLRAWSAGCSTGEEPYSLAICFKEALERVKPASRYTMQIFGTDLDRDAIDKARQGVYPANIVADVSPARLRRFFVQEGDGYRVGKDIREMVTFATQNVIMDAPFTRLDILICRNLLIYLTPELQKRLLPLFHYSLSPGGVLFLGSAETISTFTELFAPLNVKSRLYQRQGSGVSREPLAFPAVLVSAPSGGAREPAPSMPSANLESQADRLLLQRFAPPAVLVNAKGDIVYINGRTGKYLEPAAGKANWNVFAMAREGLRTELADAFQRALRQSDSVVVRGGFPGTSGGTQAVDITVQAIGEAGALCGMLMIVFDDVVPVVEKKARRGSKPSSSAAGAAELEQEVQRLRETLQATREAMQSSQEELKSTNEELQSTNEELQSTNEELTTSREEMQSLNEELQTVNAEQQSKMDELTVMNNDMRNLLNSTEIVTVFLDGALRVRRFTTGANKLFKLIPGDVGRPLTDVSNDLQYPELTEDAEQVLRTLVPKERQVTAMGGRWFSTRIMPYRTTEDVIGGVVITFVDISAVKTLEGELRAEKARLEGLLGGGGQSGTGSPAGAAQPGVEAGHSEGGR